MKTIQEIRGVFLRLTLETAQEQLNYRVAYQDACYSGYQIQQTTKDWLNDGSEIVSLWIDERLVEPLKESIKTGEFNKIAASVEPDTKNEGPKP
jgi:hypothetical protein